MAKLLGPMFENSPLLLLPIVALLIFLTVFLIIVARTFRKSTAVFEKDASLPLNDEGTDR